MASLQTLFSSSSGNSILVSGKNTDILIDCGTSAKKIADSLLLLGKDIRDIRGIVITHEHIDHVRGLAVLQKKYKIPIYAHEGTAKELLNTQQELTIQTFTEKDEFYIEDLKFSPFLTPHDTPVSVGFRVSFENEDRTLGIASDLGCITESIRQGLLCVDAIYLESNHDLNMLMSGRYPYFLKKRIAGDHGHLSNDACGCFCEELLKNGTEKFVLGHISAENNLEQLVFETANQHLAGFHEPYVLKVSPKYCAGEKVAI